jgi:hypothetical protein
MLFASHLLIIVSLALCAWAGLIESHAMALLVLGIGTILFDVGVTSDQTLGRHAIGGAVGATAAAFAWTFAGWTSVCAVAGLFGLLALLTDIATSTGTS